jgi:hypothetical protein
MGACHAEIAPLASPPLDPKQPLEGLPEQRGHEGQLLQPHCPKTANKEAVSMIGQADQRLFAPPLDQKQTLEVEEDELETKFSE